MRREHSNKYNVYFTTHSPEIGHKLLIRKRKSDRFLRLALTTACLLQTEGQLIVEKVALAMIHGPLTILDVCE